MEILTALVVGLTLAYIIIHVSVIIRKSYLIREINKLRAEIKKFTEENK